jgi:molybdopterin synthase sulfur carrier subunit
MSRSDAAAQVLAAGKAVRMALNQDICDADAVLSNGDEVAFFPPVTGG